MSDFPTQGDVQAFVTAADDATVQREAEFRGMTPGTRRFIVLALAVIALAAIVANLILTLNDYTPSDALLALASVSVGGIAGMAMPNGKG